MTNKNLNVNCKTYSYKGFTIHQITKRDYCVYTEENGCIIDCTTLKEAKSKIDKII
ncbi:MAG: hypothetical protein IJZ63_04255 [Clostridia bacterium]|nr:hypothetical protein [Clostridia bacterium]